MKTKNHSKLLSALKYRDIHDRLCLVYDSSSEQIDVTIPFIQIGLERKEKCLYIADDNSVADVLNDLKSGGIDVDKAQNDNALVVTDKTQSYLRGGYFNSDLMIKFLSLEVVKAKNEGFSGLRFAGEMTWLLELDQKFENLIEYELKLNSFFRSNDSIAIFQFNKSRFDDEFILDMIRIHPVVIYGGLVCSNVYYIPPDELLKKNRMSLEINRLLDNLRVHELSEMALLESREWFEKLNTQLRQEITERKSVEEQIRMRADQQAAIADLGQSALEGMPVQELMDKAVELVARTLDVQCVNVLELLSDKDDFILRAGVGWKESLVGKAKVNSQLNSQAGYTLNTNNPVMVEDLKTETRFTPSLLLLNHKIVSGITVIIQGGDIPFGVLGAHTIKRRLFTRDDFTFVKAVANVLAEAIERKKTTEKLKEFATNLELDRAALRERTQELSEANKTLKKEIEDRKKAEEESRDAHEFLKKIMSSATNAIYVIDLDGKFSFMNLANSKISGYSDEELIGKPYSIFFSEDTFKFVNEQFVNATVHGISISQFETQIVRKDGHNSYITFSLAPLFHNGEVTSVVGTAEDITERKHAENELQQRATEHEALSRVSRFLIQAETEQVIYDKLPQVISDSFRVEVVSIELFDKKTDEIIFMGSVGIPKEKLPNRGKHVPIKGTVSGDVIQSGQSIMLENVHNHIKYEFKILKTLGIKTFACLPMTTQNNVIGTLCLASTRKVSLHITKEIILQTIADTIAQAIERKQAEQKLKEYHLQLEELVEIRTAELKTTQEKLIHSAKLSAVGKLSASIAHEFNNPICGIRNVLTRINDRIVNDISLDETHKELAALAIKECDRVAVLIRKLQDFHKPSSGIVEPIIIHDAIDEMILMTKKKFKERKVELEKFYTDGMPKVEAVSDQIKQVILNMLQNAEDAIPEGGGKITITTERSGLFIRISIHDTGSGIPPQYMDNIFEPFFTTKPAVKGTGLGLSISYSIIKKHGGNIEVKSKPGEGTTFTIILPIKTIN